MGGATATSKKWEMIMPMKATNPNKRRCLFLPDMMWREIAKRAKAEDRTAAWWVRRAMVNALAIQTRR